MSTQSFRHTLSSLAAVTAMALFAAAAEAEHVAERAATDVAPASAEEHVLIEEVIVVGTAWAESEGQRLETALREQSHALTERLNAAIESELKDLVAPKLEILVAGI